MGVEKPLVRIEVAEVKKGIADFEVSSRKKIREYFKKSAKDLEDYMKEKAPWRDRTGDARRGLKGVFHEEGEDRLYITLEHSVYYGYWLEYTMNMNYAILEPTARLKGPDVINGMEGLLNR